MGHFQICAKDKKRFEMDEENKGRFLDQISTGWQYFTLSNWENLSPDEEV